MSPGKDARPCPDTDEPVAVFSRNLEQLSLVLDNLDHSGEMAEKALVKGSEAVRGYKNDELVQKIREAKVAIDRLNCIKRKNPGIELKPDIPFFEEALRVYYEEAKNRFGEVKASCDKGTISLKQCFVFINKMGTKFRNGFPAQCDTLHDEVSGLSDDFGTNFTEFHDLQKLCGDYQSLKKLAELVYPGSKDAEELLGSLSILENFDNAKKKIFESLQGLQQSLDKLGDPPPHAEEACDNIKNVVEMCFILFESDESSKDLENAAQNSRKRPRDNGHGESDPPSSEGENQDETPRREEQPGTCTGTPGVNVAIATLADKNAEITTKVDHIYRDAYTMEDEANEARRTIKLIRPEFASAIEQEFKDLLKTP